MTFANFLGYAFLFISFVTIVAVIIYSEYKKLTFRTQGPKTTMRPDEVAPKECPECGSKDVSWVGDPVFGTRIKGQWTCDDCDCDISVDEPPDADPGAISYGQ